MKVIAISYFPMKKIINSFISLLTWGNLWHYSTSSIVGFSAYAAFIIPLIAKFILFLIPVVAGVAHPASASKFQNSISDINSWWTFTLELLYFGALLILLGRYLTQLCCPERIRRFPYEEDHSLFIANVSSAINLINSYRFSDEDSQSSLFESLVARTWQDNVESSETFVEKWREENTSRKRTRVIIGSLFAVGTTFILFYLIGRCANNIYDVVCLLLKASY